MMGIFDIRPFRDMRGMYDNYVSVPGPQPYGGLREIERDSSCNKTHLNRVHLMAKFGPGEHVVVLGQIEGVVDYVRWARDMKSPLYQVEWWHDGSVFSREFCEADLELGE